MTANAINAKGRPPVSLPRRILIIQLGDIGDVVWSLPALRAVREAYPEATIAVLLREGNGSLLTADACPPEIFEVRKGSGGFLGRLAASLGLIRALRRQRFDIVFDLRGDERGGYMAFATGAPIRVAQHYPDMTWPRNSLFTHLLTYPLSDVCTPEKAAAPSLGILRAFGIKVGSAVPELHLSDEIRRRAAALLAVEGIAPNRKTGNAEGEKETGTGSNPGPGWVTLNPFSRWSYKEWSPKKWVQVIDWLWREHGLASVVVGSSAEREKAREITEACRGKVCNLAGKSTLAELAGILAQSRLQIGVDSAAPHIAAAVGTPTVTLYGPSDGQYWGPPGDRHRIVAPEMACAPCHRKGCDGKGISRCLDLLDVARVQAAIGQALAGRLG
ncbi:MAG: glycosyltransferase family 9 protein [Deltaproteobacteria bacterium]|nr:glycosyltransferase family 9 protein [Deltaproteobacteria bacterium]